MERFWALGHFNLGNCPALVSVVAGSRRQCAMERALHAGVDWKMPPVSALHRDMELKVPAEPERRGMALHNPVKPEESPSSCSPAAGSSLFQYPFPECPDSWIALGVGCRDEAAPRGRRDLPVEERDQIGPFHLPRDHPRVSDSRPHVLSGGGDQRRLGAAVQHGSAPQHFPIRPQSLRRPQKGCPPQHSTHRYLHHPQPRCRRTPAPSCRRLRRGLTRVGHLRSLDQLK